LEVYFVGLEQEINAVVNDLKKRHDKRRERRRKRLTAQQCDILDTFNNNCMKNIKENYADNPTVAQIILEFYALLGSQRLTTAYIMPHHLIESISRRIQSTPEYYSSLRFILILSSHTGYVSQVVSWLQGL